MPIEERKNAAAAPAIPLALLLLILVAVTAYLFAARVFPAPPPITAAGVLVDAQYNLTLRFMGAAFILAQVGLAYAAFRFRDRGQRARIFRGSVALEILWTAATTAVFLGLGFSGQRAWAAVHYTPFTADAIQVEVTESQFVFNFRYPGPDGKFGKLVPSLVSPSTGNPLGLDTGDPQGKDDIVVPTLTIPVNHPVELLIRSQDVIHNFYVRELRLQQDAVPGMVIPVDFTANRIGQYEIVCAQLCGLGHYRMRSFLNVVSADDYESFLKREAAIQ